MSENDNNLQPDSVEHIFQILNDVKAADLPVTDAVDALAYWYHEAFQDGAIKVDEPEQQSGNLQFPPISEDDTWT